MELAGELRLDGRMAGEAGTCGASELWRSPGGDAVFAVQGMQRGADPCWHYLPEAQLAVCADCTLYDRDRLTAALGPGCNGNAAELLTRAYLQWGEGMLARLDGDFAMVILDLRRRCAFAAVDPMGMRPLFYRFIEGERFVFSTSAESVASWCGLDPRIPESRLLEPLLEMEELAYVRPDIDGVSRLSAAHACRFDRTGLREQRYWSPSGNRPDLGEGDTKAWIEGVRWRMDRAVRKRVEPGSHLFGVTLSGGLDSSAVLALASRMVPMDRITAYSAVDRGGSACPETQAVDSMLAATGVDSVQANVAQPETYAAAALDALANAPRFVLGRQGFLPLFDSLFASSGGEVMLNGLDADSLFHGQDVFEHLLQRGQWRLALREARRSDRLIDFDFDFYLPRTRRLLLKSVMPSIAVNALRAVRGLRPRDPIPSLLQLAPGLRAWLLGQKREQARLLRVHARDARLPASDMGALIPVDAVGRCQARSRGYGVEMRCPFLDRDLIEFAAWIPLQLRQRNGRHKWILRKAMAPYLPHPVTWRTDKHHLACHFSRSVLGPVLDRIISDFSGSGPAIAPYVNREHFMQEVPAWRAGALDSVWRLNALLLLEHWLQSNQEKVAFGR